MDEGVLKLMIALPLGQVGAKIPWVPLLIFCIVCRFLIWTRDLYVQHQALSSIPGPGWAAWTRLWIVKTLASGESAQKFVEVNQHYGENLKLIPYFYAQRGRETGTYRAQPSYHQ